MGAREGQREREEERILQCAINSLDNDLLTKQSCGINSVLDLSPQLILMLRSFHWLAYVCVYADSLYTQSYLINVCSV